MPAVITEPVRQDALALPPPSPCLALDYQAHEIGRSEIVHADSFQWLGRLPDSCLPAALPLGVGVVADPLVGSGSTVAAEAIGVRAVGVKCRADFFEMSRQAIPQLAALPVELWESPAQLNYPIIDSGDAYVLESADAVLNRPSRPLRR